MSLQTILSDLGLTKNKGVVYLVALQTGTGSAQEIAKAANLPRTTAHEILQQLVSLGLVSFVTAGRARRYTAEPPEKLKTLLQEKERKLVGVLPELASLFNTADARPTVRFYEGAEGVKAVFEDTLTVRSKLLRGVLSMADLYQSPGKFYMDDYVQRRIAAGVRLRVIRSEIKEVEETWPTSSRELRELHYAAKETVFPMTVYIYDNKVGIIGTQQENFGMIIESQDFNQTLKNLFEVLWQVSRTAKRTD